MQRTSGSPPDSCIGARWFTGAEGASCADHLQSTSIRDRVGDAEGPADRLRAGAEKKEGDDKSREEKKEEAEEKKDEAKDKAEDAVDDRDKVVDGPGTDRSQDRRQDRRRDEVK